MATIGVISDTHGLLRPEVRARLADCDRIIHAGDIDNRETLQRLTVLGSVTVVRGNCDRGAWAANLSNFELVTVGEHTLCVVHNLDDLPSFSLDLQATKVSAVVFGHSHLPHNESRDGILYFNPGSAGPPRFGKPISMGKLHVDQSGVRGEIVALTPSATSWPPSR
jgi:putative phosphoesterase